jgi:hypothetical protein
VLLVELRGLPVNWHKTVDKCEHLKFVLYLHFFSAGAILEVGCTCLTEETYSHHEDNENEGDDDDYDMMMMMMMTTTIIIITRV